jgi:hypothetical protein
VPGEASIHDEHYGGPAAGATARAAPEDRGGKAFCALGPTAQAFLAGAAAVGNTRLGPEWVERPSQPDAAQLLGGRGVEVAPAGPVQGTHTGSAEVGEFGDGERVPAAASAPTSAQGTAGSDRGRGRVAAKALIRDRDTVHGAHRLGLAANLPR